METLVLSRVDVRQIVQAVGIDVLMDETIERLTEAMKHFRAGEATIPPRSGFTYREPATGLLEWMPCMNNGTGAIIKVVGYHPANDATAKLPTIISTVSSYDTTTGHLISLMDGTLLTAIRTGAASAIATRYMAAPGSQVLGLIGAGAQAVTQLHAISRVLELGRVLVYDDKPAVQRSFPNRAASFFDLSKIELATVDDVLRSCDVISTATSVDVGGGPVFTGSVAKPWVHINAVGSDFPGKTELPVSLLKRAFVCPDFREQALKEGECQQLSPDSVGPNLFELVQQADSYRFVKDQLSVFDSTGWALEDQVSMALFMEYAAQLNLGSRIPIEAVSADAVNPYEFANLSVYAEPRD